MALFVNGAEQDNFNINGVDMDNLYVDGTLVWSSSLIPPIYDFMQPLIESGGFKYADDTANVHTAYNGKLLNADDTSYTPSAYTEGGTIDLLTDKKMNTGFIITDEEGIHGIYDVVKGTSYKGFSIKDNFDGTADVYLWGSDIEVPSTPDIVGVTYTAPTGDYIIRELPPLITDNVDPVITRLGTSPVEVTQGNTYNDAGATAEDDRDGDITADIVTVNPVDVDVIDEYTVTYNVDDEAGNSADEVTRTVNVVAAVNYKDILISVGNNGNASSSTWNTFTDYGGTGLYDLVDEEGDSVSGATFQVDDVGLDLYNTETHDATSCEEDFGTWGYWYVESGSAREVLSVDIGLPNGTYDFKMTCVDEISGAHKSKITFNGETKYIDNEKGSTNCTTFADVVYNGSTKKISVTFDTGDTYGIINAIRITRTA